MNDRAEQAERSELAKLIDRRITELASRKSQKDIAAEVGYSSANMISMFKTGTAKVPLEKTYLLARSLEVDPILVLRLALEQSSWSQGLKDSLDAILGNLTTTNEMEIVKLVRKASGGKDPKLTADQKERMENIFTKGA